MNKLILSYILILIFCTPLCEGLWTSAGRTLSAQTESTSTTYALIDYMQVAPGMHQEYRELERVWHKIHAANIESGRYQNWILARVAFPSGSETSHNYVTRIMFRGKEQLANFMNGDESIFPDNIDAVLTEEELDLVNRTEEIRTWVKTELFSSEEYIEAEGTEFGPGMVTVFNYFGSPDGRNISSNEHLRVERAHWMPMHKANIEAGQMSAWVLLDKMLPYGNNEPYHSATVDVYESMSAYLNSSFLPVIEQMHTEAEMNAIFEDTEQAASLIRAEVRVELDRVK
ncbi:MAG: hypothetical protein AAF544_09715 [Bacteroidota bacterium]